jgi:hypothetical protein
MLVVSRIQFRWTGLLVPFLLAGCSAHPAAGTWIAVSDNVAGFSRLVVQFDGKADIYSPGQESSVRRCFWGGAGKQSITLDCVQALDTEIKERYQLHVLAGRQAELSRGEERIGLFNRQANN